MKKHALILLAFFAILKAKAQVPQADNLVYNYYIAPTYAGYTNYGTYETYINLDNNKMAKGSFPFKSPSGKMESIILTQDICGSNYDLYIKDLTKAQAGYGDFKIVYGISQLKINGTDINDKKEVIVNYSAITNLDIYNRNSELIYSNNQHVPAMELQVTSEEDQKKKSGGLLGKLDKLSNLSLSMDKNPVVAKVRTKVISDVNWSLPPNQIGTQIFRELINTVANDSLNAIIGNLFMGGTIKSDILMYNPLGSIQFNSHEVTKLVKDEISGMSKEMYQATSNAQVLNSLTSRKAFFEKYTDYTGSKKDEFIRRFCRDGLYKIALIEGKEAEAKTLFDKFMSEISNNYETKTYGKNFDLFKGILENMKIGDAPKALMAGLNNYTAQELFLAKNSLLVVGDVYLKDGSKVNGIFSTIKNIGALNGGSILENTKILGSNSSKTNELYNLNSDFSLNGAAISSENFDKIIDINNVEYIYGPDNMNDLGRLLKTAYNSSKVKVYNRAYDGSMSLNDFWIKQGNADLWYSGKAPTKKSVSKYFSACPAIEEMFEKNGLKIRNLPALGKAINDNCN